MLDTGFTELSLPMLLAGLKSALDLTDTYVYLKDNQGRYLYVNQKVQTLFGRCEQQIIGLDDSHFFDLPQARALMDNDRLVLDEGRAIEREEKNVVKATGETRYYWSVKKPLRDAQQRIIGLYGVSTDITDQKNARLTLRDRKSQLEAIIEHSFSALSLKTIEGRYVLANSLMQRLHGFSAAHFCDKTDHDLLPEPLANRIREEDLRALNSLSCHCIEEQFVIDAQPRHFESHIFPVLDETGQPRFVGRISMDMTERKQNELQNQVYMRELQESMRGALQAVANMVEARDPYTAGHERRVGILAADIAREMGWPEKKCQDMELIGLVHDIGKIAVPIDILSKPGKLTPLEYDLVKLHVDTGYQILKDMTFSLPIAQIVLQHHERLDGSGYPYGLVGAEILPEAKVLAVADVVESMASHRPYRPALGLAPASREIRAQRGRLYDEEVVDAFLRLMLKADYHFPVE